MATVVRLGEDLHRGRLFAADLAAKLLLAAVMLFALTHHDWARFSDKAMTARAVAYPLLVAIVPLWWVLLRRAARAHHLPGPGYSADIAFLLTVPFLVDVGGNALNLYDSVDRFDDACHFVNWLLLCSAVGLAVVRAVLVPPWVAGCLCVGFGAVSAILWEIAEYGAFITKTPERFTLYRDTIGDLSLGLGGSVVAGVAVAVLHRARGPLGP